MLLLLLMPILMQSASAPQDAPKAAQDVDEPENPTIRVVGRVPRCRARPGDPLDGISMAPASERSRQQVLKQDPATGVFGIFPDDDPVTGPGIWQRAGTRMDQFVFRVPLDGTPLCVGARNEKAFGWGQLRQVVDAVPYHGKTVRVTMWAAWRKAGRVWFWAASGRRGKPGGSRGADMAAQAGSAEFRGSRGWSPVVLTIGPIRCDQEKLSFGALLDGAGDLWIYQPRLEVIATQSAREATRDCRATTEKRGAGR